MENTITIQEIGAVLKKRLKMIVAITLVAIATSFSLTTFYMTPQYEANSQFIVNQSDQQNQQQITQGEIRTNVELINTYNVIIQSPAILNLVINELNLDLSTSQLASQINVSHAENSQVVNVKITDSDHAQAVELANTTVSTFKEHIPNYMNVDNVSVLSEAVHQSDPSPVSPNLTLNLAIAMILGMMIGIGLAFLLEYFDQTIKTEADLEETLDLPMLGVISTIEGIDESDHPSVINEFRKDEKVVS
ncbi:YveK family protein [Alkalibacillus aidingensis]|uniref:YveK family protein n=1 Tax=Alkalibacillus aidingensis TaxID=2747607 RepID=UPI00166076B0|nr:Wzz/FepE/Etk N-terminal domain-containing protein [Alkalibacillus aidingensis]